jgi:hypothetical protein
MSWLTIPLNVWYIHRAKWQLSLQNPQYLTPMKSTSCSDHKIQKCTDKHHMYVMQWIQKAYMFHL